MAEDYSLQTSVVIDAPAKKIFDIMLDLRQFDAWNPFHVMDPSATSSITQVKPGVGSAYEYQGKRIGRGRQVVVGISRPSLIVSEMTFLNRKTETARVEYRITEESTGTLVTWFMSGKRGFGQRVMARVLNLDSMMGKTFAQGLTKLKTYVEGKKK